MRWWAQRDLNPRPSDYESPALTTELWARRSYAHNFARGGSRGKSFSKEIGGNRVALPELFSVMEFGKYPSLPSGECDLEMEIITMVIPGLTEHQVRLLGFVEQSGLAVVISDAQ